MREIPIQSSLEFSKFSLFFLQALANRLWDLMHEETPDKFSVINQVKDENKKKELRMEDEEEDFLDEGIPPLITLHSILLCLIYYPIYT